MFNADTFKAALLRDASSVSRRLWLSRLVLVCLVLVYAVYLLRDELQARAARVMVPTTATTAPAPLVVAPPLNLSALLTVLGLQAQGPLARSSEALRLQASFVSPDGESRALLAGSSGARVYRVGERLPGGSVLRRVESDHVVLWRNGREESLALGSGASARHLLREAATPDAGERDNARRYIRPIVEQLQGND